LDFTTQMFQNLDNKIKKEDSQNINSSWNVVKGKFSKKINNIEKKSQTKKISLNLRFRLLSSLKLKINLLLFLA